MCVVGVRGGRSVRYGSLTRLIEPQQRVEIASKAARGLVHGPDGSYSLKVFVWSAGSRTKIYYHTSWAICCAVGSLLGEERYECLDDGSRNGHARLRKNI